MMACGELFLSIGVVLVDDIILPNGESRMARLGGGASHAIMGMRLWAEQIGLVSPVGQNFPEELRGQLDALFDLQGVQLRSGPSPRAWMVYEEDGTRHEVFRTDPDQMLDILIKPREYPDDYKKAKGIHLHCAAEDTAQWAEFLKSQGNPIILWEPWDQFMVEENREIFRKNASLVDVVSPNLIEGRLLTGKHTPWDVLQALLDLDAKCIALRMGEGGSLIGDRDGRRIWIPGMAFEPVTDVTGAGNAYCGGFLIGLARTRDLIQAGCSGAVSASFALEQFGAIYDITDLHEEVEYRFETIFANTPNPRRLVFDHMAEVWDKITDTHTEKTTKLARIAKAGVTKTNDRVLDVGTGTGGLLPALANCQPNSIVAIDLSNAMLLKARNNYQQLASNIVSLLQSDALFLPVADESFSTVYCHGVFPHLKEISVALQELWRVLVPGGRLVISHAIGRERVNAIHSRHHAAILREDLLPTGADLVKTLVMNGWNILENEDSEDFYLVLAEKK